MNDYIKFIYRDVGTFEELKHYLRKWTQKTYSSYRLAYLGFHGTPGKIHIGRQSITFDQLGQVLENRCANRILYFASCLVLRAPSEEVAAFRSRTKAKAVVGYGKTVDWLEGLAFEALLIDALTRYAHIDAPFDYLEKNYGQLMRKLDLRWNW
ncbi:MAG: hypothetical protein M3198_02470 [Actinomycetota bacterium]|nr:hypothetical protein [Actinomycetota bacterium]